MKKIFNLLVLFTVTLSVLLSSVGCGDTGDEKIEYSVENFTVLDWDLNERELEEFIGKPIVINFWATWCGYCKMEMPDFDEAYKKYPEVQFMMIDHTDGRNETVEKAKAYIVSEGYDFPVFFDTTLTATEKYGVTAFPTTVFISKDGNLVKSHRGMLSEAKLNEYIAMITQ